MFIGAVAALKKLSAMHMFRQTCNEVYQLSQSSHQYTRIVHAQVQCSQQQCKSTQCRASSHPTLMGLLCAFLRMSTDLQKMTDIIPLNTVPIGCNLYKSVMNGSNQRLGQQQSVFAQSTLAAGMLFDMMQYCHTNMCNTAQLCPANRNVYDDIESQESMSC